MGLASPGFNQEPILGPSTSIFLRNSAVTKCHEITFHHDQQHRKRCRVPARTRRTVWLLLQPAIVTRSPGCTNWNIKSCMLATVAAMTCFLVPNFPHVFNIIETAVSYSEITAANRAKYLCISCTRLCNTFKFTNIIRFVFFSYFGCLNLITFTFQTWWMVCYYSLYLCR